MVEEEEKKTLYTKRVLGLRLTIRKIALARGKTFAFAPDFSL